MINDKKENAHKYYSQLNKTLKAALERLSEYDFINMKDGRYEDKDNCYMNVQTLVTKQKEHQKWEAHRKYIDIQYVIKGKERMGFGKKEDFTKVLIPYDKEKDIEFLDGDKYDYIDVKEGEFVIFFPEDIHAPMLSVDKDIAIKKVIIKVPVS